MIKSRNMVGAFLEYNDKILILHRNENKKLEPAKWAGVGGHIEENEINNPLAACLREITEETGIVHTDILNLTLRYITINHKQNEIRIAFYFFGSLSHLPILITTNEGRLQWIPKQKIFSYDLSNSVRYILKHWAKHEDSGSVYVCTINNKNNQVHIVPI